MDFDAHKAEMLAHLIRMAQAPGFKAHSWHRAQQMASEHPKLYGDLPDRLKAAMQKGASDV